MESIRVSYNQVFGRIKQKINAYSTRVKSEGEESKEIFQENWLIGLTLEEVRALRTRINNHPALKWGVTLGGAGSDGATMPLSNSMRILERAFAQFPPINSVLHGKELSPELQLINSKLELLELSKIMNINLGDKKAPIHCVYLDKKDCSTTNWDTIIWHLTKFNRNRLQQIEREIQHFTSEKICEIRSYIKNLIQYQEITANSQNVDRQKKQQAIPILTNKLMEIFIDLTNLDPDKYTFIKFIQVVEEIMTHYSSVQTLETEFELRTSNDSAETEIARRINGDVLIKDHLREICHHRNDLIGSFNQKVNSNLAMYTNSAHDLLYCLKEAYFDYADKIDQIYASKVYSVNYYENNIPTDARSKAEAFTKVTNYLNDINDPDLKRNILSKINEFKQFRSKANKSDQEQKLAELHDVVHNANGNDEIFINFCTIIKNNSRVFKVKNPHSLKKLYTTISYEGAIRN